MNLWKRFLAWIRLETELIAAETWAPNTMDDPACQRTFLRQRQAVQNMKRQGIRSLLDGRPAWQRINPMSAEAPKAKVVKMRGKRNG